MTKKSKGNDKDFQIAKVLFERGSSKGEIAKIFNKSRSCISNWLRFKSWQEYCDWQKEVKVKYKKTPEQVSPEPDAPKLDRQILQSILATLLRIEKLLDVDNKPIF